MKLLVLWVHLLAVVVWIGGLMYQAHVLLPAARRGASRAFAEAAERARAVAWAAAAVVILTGFYNVTQLGPLGRVMETGSGLLLAGKLTLVIVLVALAAQRDFTQVPRLRRALGEGADPAPALSAIAWLDRIVLALAMVVIYLGLAISRP